MKYSDLINKCAEIRKTWNPVVQSLDAHAEDFLKKFTDDNERIFIKQVFFGTYRYDEFIKVFNTALFKRSPAETNRNDGPVNGIFIYLVCFRLTELPFEEFKKIVLSQNPVKMHVLFQFLFNIELLQQYVRDDWCKIYDADYIDDVVIGSIEKHLPVMAELLATISMRATGKVTDFVSSLGSQNGETETKEKAWKPTETQPFNLSESKVKALPEPIKIPKIVKSNPVPETIYSTNLQEIQDQKIKRKEEEIEKVVKGYQESKVQRFELKTEKRPTDSEKLKEEAEKKIQEETAIKTYFKPMPTYNHSEAEIKMNAATILKEEAIIKRSQQEEENYLKQIEMNMRDSSEFEKWKKQMQEKDSLEKLEMQERKRVEMQLAREAAVKAVEEKNVKNRENVQQMKELSKEGKKEMENMLAEEFEYRKQLKDTVMEARENAGVEKKKMLTDNKNKHDEMKKEKKERWFMKLEEDEVERKKREELISKIREMERRPIDRTKAYDATETMGYGLLEEMSLAQLRERYEEMKIEKQQETEKKRTENVQKKFEKEADLKSKAQEIQAVRQEQARQHQEKKMQKIKEAEEERKLKEQIREKSLLEVHGKITKKKEDKTAELERIAKELREINLKRQYLRADKAVLEAKAWKSLEDGAEREIKFRQNSKLIDQEAIESVLLRERKILAHRATTEIEAKLEYLRQYDRTLEEAKQHNEILYREEREAKKKNHEEIRSYEQAHLDNMATRDPFKSKITALNLSKAKSTLNNSRRPVSSREEIVLPPSKYTDLGRTGIIIEERPENLEY